MARHHAPKSGLWQPVTPANWYLVAIGVGLFILWLLLVIAVLRVAA